MKNDGVLYHQVSSFSRERWTKEERAIIGSVYHLPWMYSVVQYYPINVIRHNEHRLHITLCRVHFLDEEKRDASIHLICVSSLVHMSETRFRP